MFDDKVVVCVDESALLCARDAVKSVECVLVSWGTKFEHERIYEYMKFVELLLKAILRDLLCGEDSPFESDGDTVCEVWECCFVLLEAENRRLWMRIEEEIAEDLSILDGYGWCVCWSQYLCLPLTMHMGLH